MDKIKLQIRWKDCDRSKAVESSVEKILFSSLNKYSYINKNIKVEIVYYSKKRIFKVRINAIILGAKNILRSESSANTIYGAVNECIEKIEDQIRRNKTKYHNKKNSKKIKSILRKY